MRIREWISALGPGLLFAGAAIGTSHLVLSTQAGAHYGWSLLLLILAANVFKYPFFEFGIRYAAATGNDLLVGYKNRGQFFLTAYLIMTVLTMFTIVAALSVVSGGLASHVLGLSPEYALYVNGSILFITTVTLIIGRYYFLEQGLKLFMGILTICVCATLVAALYSGPAHTLTAIKTSPWSEVSGITLIVALLGWMPTAIEASSWASVWAVEKYKGSQYIPFRKSILEYNAGYLFTAILGVMFLIIGIYSLYGSGQEIQKNPVLFAQQLEQMFTAYLGGWAAMAISLAAFFTIFSSLFTAQDALARVMARGVHLSGYSAQRSMIAPMIIILAIGALVIMNLFSARLGSLLFVATAVSFLLSPLIAYMNIRVIMSDDVPEKYKPKSWLVYLSYLGLLFLVSFAAYYIVNTLHTF